MKTFTIVMAIALVALVTSPVIASSSVDLSTERGVMRGYFSGNHDQMEQQTYTDTTELSNEKGSANHDVRGYFNTNEASTTAHGVEGSIDQSRENGGV